MAPVRIRPTRDLEEYQDALGGIGHYFGVDRDRERAEKFSRILPLERMHAAFDGKAIVGGAGAFPFELTVPGGPVPARGRDGRGRAPDAPAARDPERHDARAARDVRERGEPLAALWASEETIYGRFGYGLASLDAMMRATRVHAALRPGLPQVGSVRLVDGDEALRVIPRVYERVRRRTPGFFSRSADWWQVKTLDDAPERRRGSGVLNRAVLELDGRPVGYALYRIKLDFEDATNKSRVQVLEAVGDYAVATRELWRFLLEIDWVDEIHCDLLPVDHPLLLLVQRPNRLAWKVFDGLWVRLVDVEGGARGARVRLRRPRHARGHLRSALRRQRRHVDDRRRRGAPQRRRPDVRLDVQALGAAYLGGFSFARLAAAGRVEEAARGGLARADALFRVDAAPWCAEIF